MIDPIRRTLAFVRFSHTIFAMPFALGAMLVAANGVPSLRLSVLVILAMVFARTAAMLFNRLADWEIDQRNPRTADRRRLVTRPAAMALLAACSGGFVAVTWRMNPLCFQLSPSRWASCFFIH